MTKIQEVLNANGCERLKDFYNTGPVQRAAVESFIAALAQQPVACECTEYEFCEKCYEQRKKHQAQQKGWLLVPLTPTPQMIDAGNDIEDLYRRGTPETWGKVYRAMIAAAPHPAPDASRVRTGHETKDKAIEATSHPVQTVNKDRGTND